MIMFSTIIALIIALLTNVISTWIEPSLSKYKRLTITICVGLVVFGSFHFNTEQNNEKQNKGNIIENVKQKKTSFTTHLVQERESVYFICKKYNTTPEELQKLNPTVVSKDNKGSWMIKPRYEINIEVKN